MNSVPAMNAKTLKVAAILSFIVAAGLVFQTVWAAICTTAENGADRSQAWGVLTICAFFTLLAGCLGWWFWRKANDPANVDRDSSLFKMNSPLKIVGIIFIGIFGFLILSGWLLLPALLVFYFWQKRSAKKPSQIVSKLENTVPQPVATKDNKLCRSGWLCVVLAVVLPVLVLLIGKCLFPTNGEAIGMLATGFGFIPAVMLFVAALALAVMSLTRREPHRWQSILLLVVTLSLLGFVFYNFSPEPEHTITVYRANHGNLKAIQTLVGYYSIDGLGHHANPRQEAYWTEKGARAGVSWMALEWGCLHDGLLDDPRLNVPGSRSGFAVDFLGRANRKLRDAMQIKSDDKMAFEFYQRALRLETNAVNAESRHVQVIASAIKALAYMANRYVGLAQAAEKRFATQAKADDLKQAQAFYEMASKADPTNEEAQAGLKRLAAMNLIKSQ